MEYVLGYGLMALVIGALALLNWWKTKPTAAAADCFCLLFLAARDYAVGAPALDPADRESPAVRAALARGAGETMARYDRELDAALGELFETLGTSGHLKTHYFNYLNNLFTLHKLFLEVCAAPDAPLDRAAQMDLARYMGDRRALTALLSRCMTAAGRRALGGGTAEQYVPQRKEGTG